MRDLEATIQRGKLKRKIAVDDVHPYPGIGDGISFPKIRKMNGEFYIYVEGQRVWGGWLTWEEAAWYCYGLRSGLIRQQPDYGGRVQRGVY